MGTKRLKREQRTCFRLIWQGLVLAVIGIYSGQAVWRNGLGNPGTRPNTFSQWIARLQKKGPAYERGVQIAVVVVFVFCAAAGIFYFVKGIRHIRANQTMVGKSVMSQAKSYETLRDLLHSIDLDMEEAASFGQITMIGREWVLGLEAMRIERIRGLYSTVFQKFPSLVLIDSDRNIQGCGFDTEQERDEAYRLLCSRLPDAKTGGMEECRAMIGAEALEKLEEQRRS